MEAMRCTDKENQVSFIIHTGPHDQDQLRHFGTVIAKTVPILQGPKEKVSVKFTMHRLIPLDPFRSSNSSDKITYDLTLTFDNNLHELTQDYGYEIDFHAHVNKAQPIVFGHIPLFSHKQIRTTKQMSFCNQEIIVKDLSNKLCLCPEDINYQFLALRVHICCSIARYNKYETNSITTVLISNDLGLMLLKTGHYSDVSLNVEDTVFRVHKHMLSFKSKVFKAMFAHDMAETRSGTVTISDFSAKVIGELLSFIYTGKAEIADIAIELFQAAHRYEISDLQAQCKEHFLFNVNNENVISILNVISLYELNDLRVKLMAFVLNREEQMVTDKNFHSFLCLNLKLDNVVFTLKLCDKYNSVLKDVESKVFEFVKAHNKELVRNFEFRGLFKTHPNLMDRLYVFIHS